MARTILVIAYHVLARGTSYQELGVDYYDRRATMFELTPGGLQGSGTYENILKNLQGVAVGSFGGDAAALRITP